MDRLPPAVAEWYEQQQPFSRADGQRSVLHKLTVLWDHDKHHVPMLVTRGVPNVTIGRGFCTKPGVEVELVDCHFDPSDESGSVMRTISKSEDTDCLHPDIGIDLAFHGGEGVRDLMAEAADYVAGTVIPLFRNHIA